MKAFWIALGVVVALVLSAATLVFSTNHGPCLNCLLLQPHCHGSNQRSAATTLKTFSTAQADFRTNDRDNDGVNQYWRADVAGLYALIPKGGEAIKLVELSMAAADDRPVTDLSKFAVKSPKASYWFRAIRHFDENPNALDAANRFAAVSFPSDYPRSGRWTFIVDENNTIFRADLGHGRGIDVYPSEEELKKWAKID